MALNFTSAIDELDAFGRPIDDDAGFMPASIDAEPDLGLFAGRISLWSRTIATAPLDQRAMRFRDCVAEGVSFCRDGADRGLIVAELAERAMRHGLQDELGGADGVELLIADTFRLADAAAEAAADAAAERHRPQPTRRLKLTHFRDCAAYATPRAIVKGIINKGETSALIGPPGHGKSALMTEIGISCAAHNSWRGHKVKERVGVLILALERADLYRRRLFAYRLRDGLPADLPISVAGDVVGLLDPKCVDVIVGAVRDAEADCGRPIGLIIVDTYSKGIAADNGDEDKARDANRAAANLRCVHARIDVHIALVGHTGKDESRGARGSNAHVGDVDVMVQITGDSDIRTAEIIKGNDTQQRAIAAFKLESFDLGRDEDGDPITTSIVSEEVIDVVGGRQTKKINIPAVPKAALRALYELIADNETTPRPENVHVPVGVTCITRAKWRERLVMHATISEKSGQREQFRRIHVTLKNAGKIGVWGNVVWPVT